MILDQYVDILKHSNGRPCGVYEFGTWVYSGRRAIYSPTVRPYEYHV